TVLKHNADLLGQASQKCLTDNKVQEMDLSDINIECPDWCGSAGQPCEFTSGQSVSVDGECVLGSAIGLAAESLKKLSEKQQAGFGVNVSTTVDETNKIIKSILEQQCGN